MSSTSSSSSNKTSKAADRSGTFEEYQKLCFDIEKESSYSLKTSIVADFLKSFHGDVYLLCKLLLCKEDKRVFNIKDKTMVKLMHMYLCEGDKKPKASLSDMINHLDEGGDYSETCRKYFEEYGKPCEKSTITLAQVDEFLDSITKVRAEVDQLKVFRPFIDKCTANDLKMLCKIIDHDLKINIGAKYVLSALHPAAYDSWKNNNNLRAVIDKIINLKLEIDDEGEGKVEKLGESKGAKLSTSVVLMNPIKPMLAKACKSVEEVKKRCMSGTMYCEIKYDGERIQLHKNGGVVSCYSRNLKPMMKWKIEQVEKFVQDVSDASSIILDGEILLMDTKTQKPLPFGTLNIHKKDNFTDATVGIYFFDILYLNGVSLLHTKLHERRKIMEKNVKLKHGRVALSELVIAKEEKEIQSMMNRVLREGLEGLVVKDSETTYEPAARHWLKIKKDYLHGMADTADLLVIGAYFGSGNMGGLLATYLMGAYDEDTKTYKTVCKVGNGHDEATIKRLTNELKPKMQRIEKDYNKLPKWLHINRTHVPDWIPLDPKHMPVWEIESAQFQDSTGHTSGMSMRFPRVVKIRDDKDWEDATNLKQLKAIAKASIGISGMVKSDDENEMDEGEEIYSESNSRILPFGNLGKGKGKEKVKEVKKKEVKVSKSVDNSDDDDFEKPSSSSSSKAPAKSKGGLTIHSCDILSPLGDSASNIICMVIDENGKYPTHSVAEKISKKYDVVEAQLKQGRPNLGDCILIKVREDPKLYVALLVGLKSSTFNKSGFNKSLQQLYGLANHKKCAVHLSRASLPSDADEWEKIEKKIKLNLISKGVKVYIYEHSDPKQNTDSKKRTLETSSNGEKKAKIDSSSSLLPDIFESVSIYIYSKPENNDLLERYIVAYGGEVESFNPTTTHMLTNTLECQNEECNQERGGKVKNVNSQWGWDSINLRRLCNEKE
eukprot:TRINITY_DN10155_c0_g2_i1.p1 TRINITY_DN10155_c0_g2~~TRINITY_DN10155_c0_g2_i1.p1  ORF type:complete len:958 (-),score=247.00 TRINITY_DN10155_c0_g2_i1:54-2888(-)